MMDRQAIYNRVRDHLRAQGRRSLRQTVDDTGESVMACSYRGTDGTKCAIGALIDDEHYTPELEGYGIGMERVRIAIGRSLGIKIVTTDDILFLQRLQGIHDSSEVSDWQAELRDFAREFGLAL